MDGRGREERVAWMSHALTAQVLETDRGWVPEFIFRSPGPDPSPALGLGVGLGLHHLRTTFRKSSGLDPRMIRILRGLDTDNPKDIPFRGADRRTRKQVHNQRQSIQRTIARVVVRR